MSDRGAELSVFPLTPELEAVALKAMQEYLSAVPEPNGRTLVELQAQHDRQRVTLIEEKLMPLLDSYFKGLVPLAVFKRQIDGINKKNQLWGFKGIKGQMFFNMLLNDAPDEDECDRALKSALSVPESDAKAALQLRNFHDYVVKVGEEISDRRARPKPGSIPFFVSYFWQIQQRSNWPVYYTNSVQVATDMNLWQEIGEIDNDYLAYKRLHEGLMKLFSKASGKSFTLYDVEHVFWFSLSYSSR